MRLGTGIFGSCDLFWRQVLGELKPRAKYGHPESREKDTTHEVASCLSVCNMMSHYFRPSSRYIHF